MDEKLAWIFLIASAFTTLSAGSAFHGAGLEWTLQPHGGASSIWESLRARGTSASGSV
jgi:hypothetical protein